jgi:hypothetical protein
MDDEPSLMRPKVGLQPVILAVVAVIVYLGLPILRGEPPRPQGHFPKLARAFLHGELSVSFAPGSVSPQGELIPAGEPGRFYCPYPPLPAVLLMPFAWIGSGGLRVEVACRWVSAINVLLFYFCLAGLPRKLGRPPLSGLARCALTMLFAFGMATWPSAAMGGDWHLAHALALGAMLLALWEFLGRNRPVVVGAFAAMAILSRPTTALTCLFFVFPLLGRRHLKALRRLSICPVIAIFLLALYNVARFGSPVDFGYSDMLLTGEGGRLMETYGQFHAAFVPRNLFWYFIAPPVVRPDHAFPWLGFDPRGLSLFIATPALIYCFVGAWRQWRRPIVRHAAFAIGLCLVPLLLYFNTGYWQFGHRFSMDYLPMLLVLVVSGMGPRPGRAALALIGVSVAVQAWGVLMDSVAGMPASWVPGV